MKLNCVKLGRAVTFMKHFASLVFLIFLTQTLICNKTTFPASFLLNLAELVVNEPTKSIYKNIYQYFFLYLIYQCLMGRLQGLITKELDNFMKIFISIFFERTTRFQTLGVRGVEMKMLKTV